MRFIYLLNICIFKIYTNYLLPNNLKLTIIHDLVIFLIIIYTNMYIYIYKIIYVLWVIYKLVILNWLLSINKL